MGVPAGRTSCQTAVPGRPPAEVFEPNGEANLCLNNLFIIYYLSNDKDRSIHSEYIESYPLVLPICPLRPFTLLKYLAFPPANLISSASQMDTQPQFEPTLHLKAESASAYEFSLDMDHRRRRRNRTTQSCLNCHTSKRKVRRHDPSSSSCPSFHHFLSFSVTVSALVSAASN